MYEFAETAEVSEADIIRFAKEFDPQYFHVDPVAAKDSIYKGLIGCGGHSLAVSFRIYITKFLPGKASLGSPGLDEVRWLRPVRPGDVLRMRVTILEATPSRSKTDRGSVRSLVETINQADETVMKYTAINLMGKRPA